MNLTAIRLPYYIVFSFALIASLVIIFFSWKNRKAKGVKAFTASVVMETVWLAGYMFELSSNTLEEKLFWDNVQYIGALFAPIFLLIFALQFTNRKFNFTRWIAPLFVVSALFQGLIFANLSPEMLHIDAAITSGIPFDEFTYEFGTITLLANIYVQILAVAYIIILLLGFFQVNIFRNQLSLVFVGTALPTAGVLMALALGWRFANQRDISPLMFAIGNLIIAWGIFQRRLFNVAPIAREILFEDMSNILIILDTNDRVIDINPSARQILGGLDKDELLGTHISLLNPELYQQFGKASDIDTEITTKDKRTYNFNVMSVYNKRNLLMGRLINANDITEQKRISEDLKELNIQNELRARRLDAIAEVSQAVSQIRELEKLLPVIAHQISAKFDFYHVGIFLFSEDRRFAELIAANSEGGKRMLERGHRLEVGQVGVVGRVAKEGVPRVALDVGQDAVYFDNPDLPETHSEMALPLKIGSEIIGVLDVQSKRKAIFSEEDGEAFSALANQVAIAIDNARQADATRAALEEAHALTQEYVRDSWKKIADTQKGQLGYRFTNDSVLPIHEASAEEDDGQAFEYPVQLRGETIGVIKVHIREDETVKMTENDKALLEAVGERAGLALEGARLLDDAQRRAAREQAIGEIATTISTSTNIESILRNAVQELGQKMGGAEVVLRLGVESGEKQEDDHE